MATAAKQWKPSINEKGEFVRRDSQFRNFICKDGEFTPEADRYHLYISLACPWAHRTLIVRNLKGLQDIIGLSVVDYYMGENGWEFTDRPGAIPDTLYNSKFLKEIYFRADPDYTGRFTVPVLWDKKNQTIVNNESSEILRMFNAEFNGAGLAKNPTLDFYPEKLRKEIDALNDEIYHNLNNGVYKTGFAASQEAHATNSKLVHATMLKIEDILKKKEFLVGNTLTEADIRLFTTIVRFDPVYYGHFKCNLISVRELPNLSRWMKQIYEMEGVKDTVNMVHIKHHYYESHKQINPFGIVPLYNGPLFPSD